MFKVYLELDFRKQKEIMKINTEKEPAGSKKTGLNVAPKFMDKQHLPRRNKKTISTSSGSN